MTGSVCPTVPQDFPIEAAENENMPSTPISKVTPPPVACTGRLTGTLWSDMDEELAPANQRIDDMTFKDLTARVAAAMKPKPAETAKTPAKKNDSKAAGKDALAKSKTS
jgi:hypothetical protein